MSLPDSYGTETVTGVREAAPGIPVVVLSGFPDVKFTPQALQNGAQDYLSQDCLAEKNLPGVLRLATARQRAA